MKYLPLLLLLISCNATQRVLNSPKKTQKVIDAYATTHQFKNDTLENTAVEDTGVETTTHSDTTYLEPELIIGGDGQGMVFGNDAEPALRAAMNAAAFPSINKPRVMEIRTTITYTIRTTLTKTKTIVDNSFKKELQDIVARQGQRIKLLWIGLIILVVAIGFYTYVKLRK